MSECVIDHIVIAAPELEEGAARVEECLGVMLQAGGQHPRMGTHNRLLRLGKAMYLEVIACNPFADQPDRPRWFGLDELDGTAPMRMQTWVARTGNIRDALARSSEVLGEIEAMSRGDLNWHISIPKDGSPPLEGAAPALIEWSAGMHPATQLEDYGLSLAELQLFSPQPERVERLLDSLGFAGPVKVLAGKSTRICALIDTPNGTRTLHA